jgi:hypothetical protein
MMLPRLEGLIARRVLLNYRADPAVVEKLVPAPLEVVRRNGCAVVGVCLIRLERLRPRGAPDILGLSSENLAHRVAIRYPSLAGPADGVYVWRRDTDNLITQLGGGRLFPGVHGSARLQVSEDDGMLRIKASTQGGEADVEFDARLLSQFPPTPLFDSVTGAASFFEKGECGLSRARTGGRLEGLRLHIDDWSMIPLQVDSARASFFEDRAAFPPGSVEFDCGLLMRGVRHEWSEWVPPK